MGTRFSDTALLDFLSGKMSASGEQEISEQLEVSPDLCERIDRLAEKGELNRLSRSYRKGDVLPPLEQRLARRLYEFAPLCESGTSQEEASTLVEAIRPETPADPDADTENPGGNQLGEYEILQEIGSGAMGNVYLARHRRLNRPAAVKVLSSRVASNPDAVHRFQREVAAVGKLDHKNIVKAQYAGTDAGRHYLAMDYIECCDLVAVMEGAAELSIGDACEITSQCAAGLQHASESGIVHRDIKASNLLLTSDGTVKIADFGLAKLRKLPGSDTDWQTIDNHIIGTLEFMAPEQLDDSRDVDIRADIYSLGCTLYYLLTGKTPHNNDYQKGGLLSMLTARQHRTAVDADSLPCDLPDGLVAVLETMLAPKPEDRYATPKEVSAALEEFSTLADLPKLWSPVAETLPANSLPQTPLECWQPRLVPPSNEAAANQSLKPTRQFRLAVFSLLGTLILAATIGTAVFVSNAKGKLHLVIDQPDAVVLIDGEPVANSSDRDADGTLTIPLAPGSYEIVVQKQGFEPHRQSGEIQRFGSTSIDITLKREFYPEAAEGRRVAEWLLSLGAKLTVALPDQSPVEIGKNLTLKKLPDGPYEVTRVECYRVKMIDNSNVDEIFKLARLKWLSLRGTQVTGSGLENIARLRHLTTLVLWHNPLNNEDLKHLSPLTNLTSLTLADTGITDKGLAELTTMTSLRRLKLGHNKITDEGMKYLVGLPNLEHVALDDTRVTVAGIQTLTQNKSLKDIYFAPWSPFDDGKLDRLREQRPELILRTGP